MARRSHYERAFSAYLSDRRASFAFLNDARRVVAGEGARLALPALSPDERDALGDAAPQPNLTRSLKSFDLILYSDRVHAIVDVKGRKVSSRLHESRTPRLENWVTRDDVESLRVWETLFGAGYEAAFVFIYWCEERPPARHFDDRFEHAGRWYGLRGAWLSDYRAGMRERSRRWGTVQVDQGDFDRLSRAVFGAGELYCGAAAS